MTKREEYPLEKADLILEAMEKELRLLESDEGKRLPDYGKHVLRAICQLAAFGISHQRIATKVCIPTSNVKLVLKSQSIQREVARLQSELFMDSKRVFQAQLPDAANTVYKIMKSKSSKDSTRVEAAKVIMDRALGRPVQHIEQQTTLLKDVFVSLQNKKEEADDAVLVPETPQAPKKDKGPLQEKDSLEDLLEDPKE